MILFNKKNHDWDKIGTFDLIRTGRYKNLWDKLGHFFRGFKYVAFLCMGTNCDNSVTQ